MRPLSCWHSTTIQMQQYQFSGGLSSGCALLSLLAGISLSIAAPESLPVQDISVDQTGVTIQVNPDPSRYYVLDRLNLETGEVTDTSDLVLGSESGQLKDPTPPLEHGFYQVRAFDCELPGDIDRDGINDMYELSNGLDPFDDGDANGELSFDGGTATQLEAYLQNYEVGRGRHDVTGVAAQGGMMGYAEGSQTTLGIHDRQWARAFIVRDRRPPHRRVVYVVVDAGQMFQSVVQGVHDKLRDDPSLRDHYSYQNMILSATHTHGGAGGHSHYALFHASIGGFSWRSYDAMVHGIYMAIKKAHFDLKPGAVQHNRGQLTTANENRRPEAFKQNVEITNPSLTNPYGEDNRDTEMFALRFEHAGVTDPIAAFNWFPTHGVSVSKFNQLLTGDNKGNAAYLFEQSEGAIYPGFPGYRGDRSTFVAGFSNSNPGDLTANRRTLEKTLDQDSLPEGWTKSPNWPSSSWPEPPSTPFLGIGWPGDYDKDGEYGREEDYARATLIGGRQYEMAKFLHEGSGDFAHSKVTGGVDYRHRFVNMGTVTVNPESIYPYDQPGVDYPAGHLLGLGAEATCPGALGVEFAGGTLDGEALGPGLVEFLVGLGGDANPTGELEICQHPKDIIIGLTGLADLAPQWIPVSLQKVGNIVILAVPSEFTVMAGYRLRKTVENVFAESGQKVRAIIAGLSNSYSGYVVTYEEYMYEEGEAKLQGYEAASTHFGAFTLMAYQKLFAEMAQEIVEDENAPLSPKDTTIPAYVKPDVPIVTALDKIVVLDVAPLPETVAGIDQEDAGCPVGQVHDILSGDCFNCPDGYNRRLLLPIDDPEVCEKSVFAEATRKNQAGCPDGEFPILGTNSCWKCPAGYQQALIVTTAADACEKPASSVFTAADSAESFGGTDCPDGYVYDLLLGRCYKCPDGFNKDLLKAWNNTAACTKRTSQSTSADSAASFGGTDCPDGYVYDFILGRCYKCPNGYNKHLLRAWNTNNACEKNTLQTTSAEDQASTSGINCPSGYVYDFILGRCYKCPSSYSKHVLRAWNSSNACTKTTTSTRSASSRAGTGIIGTDCPNGYVYDLILGRCYKCASGYSKHALRAWNAGNACVKTTTSTTSADSTNGTGNCPAGYAYVGSTRRCYKCPSSYAKNILRSWTATNACERTVNTTAAANSANATGGIDCPNGYVYDLLLGRCYKCPDGYNKHLLRAWNTNNACEKITVTTAAASSATATGGIDCPDGYVYDFLLGECYKCPDGYNKYILRPWDHALACERIIPRETTAADAQGEGGIICPTGQRFDLITGSCWTCPDGYNHNLLSLVDGDNACQKIVYDAATTHGKFFCHERDPTWHLNVLEDKCQSCPPGSVEVLGVCVRAPGFGDVRTYPSGSYTRGQTMTASFWAGHPKNIFGTFSDKWTNGIDGTNTTLGPDNDQYSFFRIQRNVGGSWQTVRTDANWDTVMEWTPQGLSSAITIKWEIPSGDSSIPAGTYRVVHDGFKSGEGGVIPYVGSPAEFEVK